MSIFLESSLSAKEYLERSLKEKGLNYNLQYYYDYLNKTLFNNELQTYPIKYASKKNVGGSVTSFGIRNKPSTWEVQEIVISDFYEMTEEQLKGIMVHEMIHVWQIETKNYSNYKDQHDYTFKDKVAELQKKVDFTIPLSEDRTDDIVSSSIKVPYLVILIVNKQNKQTSVVVYSLNNKANIISKYQSFPDAYYDNFDIFIYEHDDPNLQKYPIKRDYPKKWVTYAINDSLLDSIIRYGKLIWTSESKR